MDDLDDIELLDRWSAGDRAAGSALFDRHFEALYRFLDRKTDGEIDELVQETLEVCVRSRDRFRRESSFRTYLFGIARNVLHADWRRRAAHLRHVDFDEVSVASLSTSIGTRMARRERHAQLLWALQVLPLDQQLLLELHYWEDLSAAQLAVVFGIQEVSVRTRLFRARQALRLALEQASGRPLPAMRDEEFDEWARSLRPAAGPDDPDDDS